MSNNQNNLVYQSQDHIMALLSKLAYKNLATGSLANFYDSEFAEDELDYLKNYTVLSTSSSHGYTTGFYGCFLENNITHEIVYAIRGTEGIMSDDIDDDLDTSSS